MRTIYDTHAHIVPAVDDGASDFNMAIDLLKMAEQQGIKKIVCTSHSGMDSKKYIENFKTLQNKATTEEINIKIYCGCEIYCTKSNILHIIDALNKKRMLTINNTRYVLVEFSPYAKMKDIVYCVEQLHRHQYEVIIAHVERYYDLHARMSDIKYLLELGCLFQINAYSLKKETDMRIKTFSRDLLKERYVTFVGSDVHRTNHRSYAVTDGVEYIYQHCDIEYANNICYQNADRILNMH